MLGEQRRNIAETSSAPAANSPVVGTAAAALAELIVEPMLAKSVAAEAIISGIAITNDIPTTSTSRPGSCCRRAATAGESRW
ncbi:hypothetical protein AWC07_24720 [Mycobacterium gastri]|uniref:Uncharacterized protein n=1 Tax=Mycobacterium gastri TaxID=1777 RepID=A0A1X1VY81_MYCGS|nr:hypothetical protein AWC07_24720 [Mycobacterium gastri]